MVSAARLNALRDRLEVRAVVQSSRPDVSRAGDLIHGDEHVRVYWDGESSTVQLRGGGVTVLAGACAACVAGLCGAHNGPV